MDKRRPIHFVGIGGVGMSGIAEVLISLGYRVGGSDLKETELTRRLQSLGAIIGVGHKRGRVAGAQVVVVTSAVDGSNPEVREARRLGIPVLSRGEMLAELARLKKTITISGSHGKTTTTSMTAMALKAAGADPTVIVGGQLKNIGSNASLGSSEYLVAEADESDGSFLKLAPYAAIVTNVDDDHLDYYGTFERLKQAFAEHLRRVPFYGAAVLCVEDPVVRELAKKADRPLVTYGLTRGEWRARDLKLGPEGSRFTATRGGKRAAKVELKVSGRHNVLNALGALACGVFLGFPPKKLAAGLSAFRGVGRRLETLGRAGGVTFVDDYGHHPTEIRATIRTLVDVWRPKRLWVIFQPHRFSRTKLLQKAFGPAFRGADRVLVTDIYPAGERPMRGVTRDLVLRSLSSAGVSAAPFTGALEVAKELRTGDVLLTIGAGDVWKIGEDLRRRREEHTIAAI
jgi:UDP-N-acetylmuramate--alanine ligase